MMEETQRKANSHLSKKRFFEIEAMVRLQIEDEAAIRNIMEGIKEIMCFDPQVSGYTHELGKKKLASLKKRCEETGKTSYQLLHRRKLCNV
jgi:hypothetical protein